MREYKKPQERRAAGRWPALDTTMVELQGTHGGSFGGGPEKERWWTLRTGAYVLLDWRNLLSRITRLYGEGRWACTVGWVEGDGGCSEPDQAGRGLSSVGFF